MNGRGLGWRRATVGWVLWAQLLGLLGPALTPVTAGAQRPEPGRSPVERGQEYYELSRFDEAIALLRDLVDRGVLTGGDQIRAWEILARSYVQKGDLVQAKDLFKNILRQDPTWRPDPIRVPPNEMAVFEQARREGNAPPPTPCNPYPADQATEVPDTTRFVWGCIVDPDGDAVSFEIYLGTTATPARAATVNSPLFLPPVPLTADTRHYWRVETDDGRGGRTSGPVWTFMTAQPQKGLLSRWWFWGLVGVGATAAILLALPPPPPPDELPGFPGPPPDRSGFAE